MAGNLAPLVLCGPSGSGKSTLMKKLMAEFEDSFGFSVSHTTRSPRPGEEDGTDYHFSTREEMKSMMENNEFVENAEFSGNMYGTSKKSIQDVLDNGKICILDIDVQGVKAIKKVEDIPKPLYVFMKPPSLQVLEERLRARGTETEESLQKRLGSAAKEMEYGEEEGNFDVIIVNDELDAAYDKLKQFMLENVESLGQ